VSAVLTLQQVDLRYGRGARAVMALQAVSLTVRAGERVALIGANGCGKSSLLRVLHGLLPPSCGSLQVANGVTQAMLFQKPYLMRLSVLANVALGPWLRGTAWHDALARAHQALGDVGLTELAARSARQLSGGQQQRVALARALALRPQVLLLDEPTASLDPHAKREVEAHMHQLAEHNPAITLVFASHNLGQVKRLASRVVYLEQGRVLADLPVQEFFNGPLLSQQYPAAHAFVRGEQA